MSYEDTEVYTWSVLICFINNQTTFIFGGSGAILRIMPHNKYILQVINPTNIVFTLQTTKQAYIIAAAENDKMYAHLSYIQNKRPSYSNLKSNLFAEILPNFYFSPFQIQSLNIL